MADQTNRITRFEKRDVSKKRENKKREYNKSEHKKTTVYSKTEYKKTTEYSKSEHKKTTEDRDMPKDKQAKVYRVKCRSYDSEGRGIVHFNGSDIPVEGLIIGEMAHISLKHTKDETIGILKDVEIVSRDRIAPPCPYHDKCGNCQMMHMNYGAQLFYKQQIVESLIGKYCPVEPVLGMNTPENFRTKVHATFAKGAKGRVIAGAYEAKSHRVIDINNCLVQNQKANDVIISIKKLMQKERIEPYDEDKKQGILRHVLVRVGQKTGQVMVVLVIGSSYFPGKKNFMQALLKKHPEITTIVVNENNKKTSMILGDKEEIVFGSGWIEDELCGVRFRISPKSFYQVNPGQTEVLYQTAIQMADLKETDTVLDAYCGIGTIALICAPKVKEVLGVELNSAAVKNARANSQLNKAENVQFICDDAGAYMKKLAVSQKQVPDVVFMDPPRSGCSRAFLEALVKMSPKKAVYISCNPVTLTRDLEYLTNHGYKAEKAVPVDMFGWSHHIETCVILKRLTF